MAQTRIMIIDDTPAGLQQRDFLSHEGFEVVLVADGAAAEATLKHQSFDMALLDTTVGHAAAVARLRRWRGSHASMRVIAVTGQDSLEKTVACVKAGAYDVLTRPVELLLLKKCISNATESLSLTRTVQLYSELQMQRTTTHIATVVAESPAMRQVMDMAQRVSQNCTALFIRGESGTGKGLLARTIHQLGPRAAHPFVEVNCAALPAHLVESELFGHRKGAFTDAKEDKVGLFELANGGTLFLDEVGDMEHDLQAKLLKVIEEKTFRRVGDTRRMRADVVVIAATNQEVEVLVRQGRFREDLFYRLNVVPLILPPLRARPEDIPALCLFFLDAFARKVGKPAKNFSPEAMQLLRAYSWPGNVRELRNVVERGCLLSTGDVIGPDLLLLPVSIPVMPASPPSGTGTVGTTPTLVAEDDADLNLQSVEKRTIQRALAKAAGNRNQAAILLGIHRATLYRKMTEYGLG